MSSSRTALARFELTLPEHFMKSSPDGSFGLDLHSIILDADYSTLTPSARIVFYQLVVRSLRAKSLKIDLNVTMIVTSTGLRRSYFRDALDELEAAGLISNPPELRGKSRHEPRVCAHARSSSSSSLISKKEEEEPAPKKFHVEQKLEDHPAFLHATRMKYAEQEPAFIELITRMKLLGSLRSCLPKILYHFAGDVNQFEVFCTQTCQSKKFSELPSEAAQQNYVAVSVKKAIGVLESKRVEQ